MQFLIEFILNKLKNLKMSKIFYIDQLLGNAYELEIFLKLLFSSFDENYSAESIRIGDKTLLDNESWCKSESEPYLDRIVLSQELYDSQNIKIEVKGTFELPEAYLSNFFVSQEEYEYYENIFKHDLFDFGNISRIIRTTDDINDDHRGTNDNEFDVPILETFHFKKGYAYSYKELAEIYFKFKRTKFNNHYEMFGDCVYIDKTIPYTDNKYTPEEYYKQDRIQYFEEQKKNRDEMLEKFKTYKNCLIFSMCRCS